MKKPYIIIVLIFIVSNAWAQRMTRELSSFRDIDIFGPFEVTLVKSDKEKAEIDFRGIDKEDVIVDAEKGVLKLKIKNRHYIDDWKNDRQHHKYILVTVYYTDIDMIEASAGAVVTTDGTLKSKYLSVDCTMGAEVTLDIFTEKAELISNMGAVLEVTGQTNHIEVNANMGGVLKAAHLESKTAYVKANMGADVTVNVMEELEASAGFGAQVEYIGGPSVRHTSKNFGGEVNRRGN
ncbi:MAG: head GIN domain-containing protein [Cyclobacteriaceae bacterium]